MRWAGAGLAVLGAVLLGASSWWPWQRAPDDAGFFLVERPTWLWLTKLDLVLAAAAVAVAALALSAVAMSGRSALARPAIAGIGIAAAGVTVYRIVDGLLLHETFAAYDGAGRQMVWEVPHALPDTGAALAVAGALLVIAGAALPPAPPRDAAP